jgi:hypothetical protein
VAIVTVGSVLGGSVVIATLVLRSIMELGVSGGVIIAIAKAVILLVFPRRVSGAAVRRAAASTAPTASISRVDATTNATAARAASTARNRVASGRRLIDTGGIRGSGDIIVHPRPRTIVDAFATIRFVVAVANILVAVNVLRTL